MANSGLLEIFALSAWLESTPSPWAELSLLLRKACCRAAMARQVCPGMLLSSCASACMFGCHSATAWWWLKWRTIGISCKHRVTTLIAMWQQSFRFPCSKHQLPEKHLQNHCCILLLMTFRIMVLSDFCFLPFWKQPGNGTWLLMSHHGRWLVWTPACSRHLKVNGNW